MSLSPDMINGSFELGGALFSLVNVRRLMRDQRLEGVSWIPTCFFTAWGLWNLYYYPALDQWYSFTGGLAIVLVNASWLILVAWYAYLASFEGSDV